MNNSTEVTANWLALLVIIVPACFLWGYATAMKAVRLSRRKDLE